MTSDITNMRIVACCTASALGIATVGFGLAAVTTTAGTTAMVAYGIFTVFGVAASIASLTAWADSDSQNVKTYFSSLGKHMLFTIPGTVQFVAQNIMQAIVQGVAEGVRDLVRGRIENWGSQGRQGHRALA